MKTHLFTGFYIGIFVILLTAYGLRVFYDVEEYQEYDYHVNKKELEIIKQDMQKISDALFDNIIKTPEVIGIFQGAAEADEAERGRLRTQLYEQLYHAYQGFSRYGIRQLHFRLPDNRSFLRFHRHGKYGDDLSDVRASGFEEGWSFNGYRFVYPMFSAAGKHIGSVEISCSLLAFKKMFEKNRDAHIDFILPRERARAKVFASEQDNYLPYRGTDDFVIQSSMHAYDLENNDHFVTMEKAFKRLQARGSFSETMASLQPMHKIVFVDYRLYSMNFIPLRNDFTGEAVGFAVIFHYSRFLDSLLTNNLILGAVFLIFAMIFGVLLYFGSRTLIERREKEEFAWLFDSAQVGLLQSSGDRVLIKVNPRLVQMLGYDSPEEMAGLSMRQFHLSEENYREFGRQNFDSLQRGAKLDIVYPVRKKDGSPLWVSLSGKALDKKIPADLAKGVLWSVQDLSEIRAVQAELQQANERWKAALSANDDGVWEWNVESGAVYFSPRWFEMLGFEPGALPGTLETWKSRVHSDDMEATIEAVERYLGGEGERYRSEHRIQCKDGSYIWVLDRGIVVERTESGAPLRMIGTHHDISIRKIYEKSMLEERNRAKRYLDMAGSMIVALDRGGTVTMINQEGCEILGLRQEEIVGQPWIETFLPESERVGAREIFEPLMQGRIKNVRNVEKEVLTGGGERRLIQWRNGLLYDDEGAISGTLSSGVDITEQRAMHLQVIRSEQQFRQIFDRSPLGIFYFDTDWVTRQCNSAFAHLLGVEVADIIDFDMKARLTDEAMRRAIAETLEIGKGHFEGDYTSISAGVTNYLRIEFRAIYDEEGNIVGGIGISEILTDLKSLERELREQHDHLQRIIDGMADGVTVFDQDYRVLLLNRAAAAAAEPGADLTKCYGVLHHAEAPCDASKHSCPLHEVAEQSSPQKALHRQVNAEGRERLIEISIAPLTDETGGVYAFVETSHDVTELITMREELDRRVNYDTLTGLPNRRLFRDRLNEYIKRSGRDGSRAVVILVDIDHLKGVNDSFGHQAGDRVIKTFGNWLMASVREQDTVARFSGDAFAILLEAVDDDLAPVRILEELRRRVDDSYVKVIDHELHVSFSAGIARFPEDGGSAEIVFKNSDAALYAAKEAGRNTYRYYTNELTDRAFERVMMDTNLRDALQHDEFVLYYQPQYDIHRDALVGMEALIRWRHSSMGLIPPGRFIPLLESSGLIIPVGTWILKEAFTRAVQWRKAGYEPGVLSVNLSVVQLKNGEALVGRIVSLLGETGCRPEWIGIEVTESTMMDEPEAIIAILQRLSELGFQISIDDFGTGYSSLSYLKRLPLDKLKLDKSFIDNLPDDENDVTLSRTIIAMAENLKLKVIAEGVETEAQRDFLRENGCDEIQGYLYSRPLTGDDMETVLNATVSG